MRDFQSGLGATGIHESGHAIAAHYSPTLPRVLAVTLGIGSGGGCTHLRELDPMDSSPRTFHEGMRVLAAGYMAEALAGGRPRFEGGDADKLVRMVALYAEWTARRAPAPTTRTAGGVAARRVVSAACAQARDAMRDAELLLRAHWGEVTLVAQRLLTCGGGMNAAFLESTIEVAQRRPAPKVDDAEHMLALVGAFEGRHAWLEGALRQQLA